MATSSIEPHRCACSELLGIGQAVRNPYHRLGTFGNSAACLDCELAPTSSKNSTNRGPWTSHYRPWTGSNELDKLQEPTEQRSSIANSSLAPCTCGVDLLWCKIRVWVRGEMMPQLPKRPTLQVRSKNGEVRT